MNSTGDHARGIVLMLAAGLCWSLGGLIVRLLRTAGTWEIVFWRSLFMGAFVALLLVLRYRREAPARVRAIGPAGVASALCLAAQIHLFVLALRHTGTAQTFVLMSLSPLVLALAGRAFLKERIAPFTWGAIAFAFIGIIVMFSEGLGPGHGGHWLGNLFALGVPVGYACQVLLLRRMRGPGGDGPDLMPTLLVAGVAAALPALPLAGALQADMRDIGLLALMGCVQLGMGCWLMTLAVPRLRAAEVGLLALTETILAPLWVWLGAGERPATAALAGGALIVGALGANGALSLRADSMRR